jgi:molecular chaperone GrpE
VLDNLYRASETQTADVEYQSGVKMVLNSFTGAFAALGVTEIPTDGIPFDPTLHEAILQQESEDAESGTVLQTAQKGYIFKDRVIRAPKVIVAK